MNAQEKTDGCPVCGHKPPDTGPLRFRPVSEAEFMAWPVEDQFFDWVRISLAAYRRGDYGRAVSYLVLALGKAVKLARRHGFTNVEGLDFRNPMGAVLHIDAEAQDTALYRHFAADGALLYVGISLSAVARLSAHEATAPWFRDIARVEVAWYPSRDLALAAEKAAIKRECPRHNIVHNERGGA